MSHRSVHWFEFAFIGIASVIAQTVFLRRLIGLFGGSELQYALLLTIWLFEAGVWSLLAQRLIDRSPLTGRTAAPILYLSLTLLYPCYAILPVFKSLIFSPLSISPISQCGMFGLFALVIPTAFAGIFFAMLNSLLGNGDSNLRVGETYLLDTIGFAVGGLAITAVLVVAGADAELLVLLGVVGVALCVRMLSERRKKLLSIALGTAWIAFAAVLLRVEYSQQKRADHALSTADSTGANSGPAITTLSPYGRIDIRSQGLSTDFYFDSRLVSSYPGADAGESIILPLAMIPSPHSVAILGGSLDGRAVFALVDTMLTVSQVEPDPVVRGVFDMMFMRADASKLDRARLRLINSDPVAFLAGARETFDLIFINYSDPTSVAQGNYFTREFFDLVKRRLSDGGVLAFAVRCGDDFIPPERAEYIKSLLTTVSSAFSKVAIVPGEMAMIVGGADESLITVEADRILARSGAFGIHLAYYGSAYLHDILSQWRIDRLNAQLASYTGSVLTTRRPQGFLLNSAFEMGKFAGIDSAVLRWLRSVSVFRAAALCLIPVLLFGAVALLSSRAAAHLPVFFAGWFGLSVNVLLIAAYQSVAGSIFSRLGMLTGCFMAGMAIGAYLGLRPASRLAGRFGLPAVILLSSLFVLSLGLIMPAWIGSFEMFGRSGAAILLASVISGVFPGLIFNMSAVSGSKGELGEGSAGSLYGIDLLGSSIGGLGTTLILLPTVGVSGGFLTVCFSGLITGIAAVAVLSLRNRT